ATGDGGAPGRGAVTGSTAGGLPKRRRRQPAAGHGRPAAPPPTELPRERTAEETARRMGAFARGTRSGRTGNHPLPHLPGGHTPGQPSHGGPTAPGPVTGPPPGDRSAPGPVTGPPPGAPGGPPPGPAHGAPGPMPPGAGRPGIHEDRQAPARRPGTPAEDEGNPHA
ncbi:hypothetical protein AB0K89_12275, partial [Streptomyces cinnamoneus]